MLLSHYPTTIINNDHGGFILIVARVTNFCWFLFKWGLLLGVIGAVVAVSYFYHRINEEIRLRVESRIARHYADLKVSVRCAELVDGKGIEVRGLAIAELGEEGPHAELVYFDEVFLHCPTGLQELARGEPEIEQITIRRPTLRVTRRPDGTWSVAKLLPIPRLGEHPPQVKIENGTIEIFDSLNTPASTLTLRDVNLTLSSPSHGSAGALASRGSAGASPSQPAAGPHARKLQGTLSGDYLGQVELQGLVDPHQGSFSIDGLIGRLEISPEMRRALPAPLAAKLEALGQLRGQATLEFRLAHDPAAEAPYRFELSGRLEQGRIDDPRLPHPLGDVCATFRLDNSGVVIEEFLARSSQATLKLSARQTGFEPGTGPLALEAEIRQLELDGQLLDILPKKLQDLWHKYRPAGRIDADVKLSYDGRTWRPEISVGCLNVSFTHHKFPYRLEGGKGSLTLADDLLRMGLTAYSRSQSVRLDAEIRHPTSGPIGWFEAKGEDLQLDEKLFVAIPERSRAVVRLLDPRGTINFHVRLWRDRPGEPLRKHLLVGLNSCSIRYARFPYPLANVRGALEMLDDSWTFRDLEGTNDTGRVTCEGKFAAGPQGKELWLRFAAADVPLEEELRDAMRPHLRRAWKGLRPRGMVDLKADVHYLVESKKLNLDVRVWPHAESTSICPVHFPYRMEKLAGALHYRNGHVTLQRFKAEHGPVRMSTTGQCELMPDGGWRLHLAGLSVDRLRMDRELLSALPERLKKAITTLEPVGPIDLRGSFDLERVVTGAGLRSGWDLAVGFDLESVDCGVNLRNVHGSMTLRGGFDGKTSHSRGQLDVDSLNYEDFQFTRVAGPVWIDDRQVLLGSWVDRREVGGSPRDASRMRRRPQPLSGRLFGGTVYGDGWVALGPVPRYRLRANLVQAELARCAQEVMAGRQNLRGKINATVDLWGNGRGPNSLGGHGKVQLRDADIYELPLIISLLKILSIHEPDRTAFTKSDIDFRIEGKHIYFNQIDFTGDAISMLGKGEMDFQKAIRLTFHTIVGTGDVSLLKALLSGASRQIMEVHVGGTLQNPKIRREPLPVLKQTIEGLERLQTGTPNVPGLWSGGKAEGSMR